MNQSRIHHAWGGKLRLLLTVALLLQIILPVALVQPVQASTVSEVTLTGGAGTIRAGIQPTAPLWARQGGIVPFSAT